MKVVILAGGFGTRLAEVTTTIPKPMVTIGGKPIIFHIMQRYAAYGLNDFALALGYKSELIKEYFMNFRVKHNDFTINLNSGSIDYHAIKPLDWNVTLVDTGESTMTGGRLKRLRPYLNETFLLTYGDGLANIDISALLQFHKKHGKMVTVTAVHPGARFGELSIDGDLVKSFKEKPQLTQGWVNGGFFVIEPEFLDLIDSDETLLEHEPLERTATMNQLMAYKHEGFWQCMDTKRDHDYLESLWLSNNAPWVL